MKFAISNYYYYYYQQTVSLTYDKYIKIILDFVLSTISSPIIIKRHTQFPNMREGMTYMTIVSSEPLNLSTSAINSLNNHIKMDQMLWFVCFRFNVLRERIIGCKEGTQHQQNMDQAGGMPKRNWSLQLNCEVKETKTGYVTSLDCLLER